MTNGDKIRQRFANCDDVTLYHGYISDKFVGVCPPDMEHGDKCPHSWSDIAASCVCVECWLRWLGQEADDD